MILSTGVNAAAGGVVGNIMASGDSVLRIEDCQRKNNEVVEKSKCLWGYVLEGDNIGADEEVYFNVVDRTAMVCSAEKGCTPDRISYIKIRLKDKEEPVEYDSLTDQQKSDLQNGTLGAQDSYYWMEGDPTGKNTMKPGFNPDKAVFVRVASAVRPKNSKPALVWGIQDKFFGMKRADWYKWKDSHADNAEIYWRNTAGNADGIIDGATLNAFEPMFVDASDGGVVDLNNKARLKDTMIGAGAGGALGAFTAYQGAQSDIDARWVAAVREYKDSLQKFYCATGSRFLSYYNDTVIIPNIDE